MLVLSQLTFQFQKFQRNVKKKNIIIKIIKINDFYKKVLKIKPRIAITGLNPHCENFDNENKEKKKSFQLLNI